LAARLEPLDLVEIVPGQLLLSTVEDGDAFVADEVVVRVDGREVAVRLDEDEGARYEARRIVANKASRTEALAKGWLRRIVPEIRAILPPTRARESRPRRRRSRLASSSRSARGDPPDDPDPADGVGPAPGPSTGRLDVGAGE
jgi:hypothetical protein